ncbi:lateral signaling target protein 2 homolog isoform X2 [Nilaparvata lugens]|nr:lateral signaling target protein 2 homolog isoform X2 [Nilaparvata lugens]
MDELIPDERADRDFRVKFPDDVMQDNLAGQLWFGAECLAAGSSIMNRETESGEMRPLAKALTKSLEKVRQLLREAALRAHAPPPPLHDLAHDRLVESLKMFDRLLAQFELCYVSAMVPVKTVQEYELQQCVIVLFSETLNRALEKHLLSHEQVDQYDPALMFTIPRLAIVAGLLVFPEGPLSLDDNPQNMSEMFRPFRTLLVKIRELLWTLSDNELLKLEKMLCSCEEVSQSPISEVDISEVDDNSEECAAETSECETVRESLDERTLPTLNNDECVFECDTTTKDETLEPEQSTSKANDEDSNSLSSLLDSGLGNTQSGSERDSLSDRSPDAQPLPAAEDTNQATGQVLPTDDCDIMKTEDNQSTSSVEPCGFSLNGQWTLPVIPCSCSQSASINEDVSMTHRGLMNRGIPQDDGSYLICGSSPVTCDCCQRARPPTPSSNQPSSSDVHPAFVHPVVDAENRRIILPNGASILFDRSPRCWKRKAADKRGQGGQRGRRHPPGEASVDLQVRYAHNWNALHRHRNSTTATAPAPTTATDIPHDNMEVSHSLSSSCSSCTCSVPSGSYCMSSDTSSFDSEYQDEEEVALAVRAAEAASSEARSKFRSSEDLIHRLFVCIAGVADQLQTNFAGDLRNILKSVFLINSSDKTDTEEEAEGGDCCENGEEALVWGESERAEAADEQQQQQPVSPPPWVPDILAPTCMSCTASFTVVRRRHHCRNCGKVFCARCSSNSVPLPRFGHLKPVRVCNRCFVFHVTPFLIDQITSLS